MPVSRNPGDITVRLNNVIEHLLQGDNVDEALIEARIQATFLLEELDWFLGYTPHPEKGAGGRLLDHAAEAGLDRGKLEHLRREVGDGRVDILSGDLAIALKRFKEARDDWMKPAKKGE